MKFLDTIASKLGFVRRSQPRSVQFRNYTAAGMTRLLADWMATGTSGDAELRTVIKTLRDRSRDAERNEDYMRSYLRARNNNVIGACGIDLRMKVTAAGGQPDKRASKTVQDLWYKWGRKEFCSVTRRLTWNQLAGLTLRGEATGGGALVRKIRGFNNAFGYALQPLEIDHLAIDLDNPVNTGSSRNEIRFGVELDQWHAPVAYHLWPQHPGDYRGITMGMPIRIPASEILHLHRPDRVTHTISAPAASSALFGMKMFRAYQEAEIIAAREGACKGYAVTQAAANTYNGDQGTDSLGRELESVEPGMKMLLNPGETITALDPKHPTDAFPDFTKTVLRGIAAGLGMSYNSLANDLENVNYSSIRAGLLEEREEWKATQEWLIAELYTPIFEDWLAWCLFQGLVPGYTMADFDRLNQPMWRPRRWDWVDPEKDIEAARKSIALRINSREAIIAEAGRDKDEVDAEFAADEVTTDLNSELAYVPEAARLEAAEAQANEPIQDTLPAGKQAKGLGVNRLLAGLRD